MTNLQLTLANAAAAEASRRWREHRLFCPPCSTGARSHDKSMMCAAGARLHEDHRECDLGARGRAAAGQAAESGAGNPVLTGRHE